jgi:hypothetical protein
MERREYTRGFKLEAERLMKQRGVSFARASTVQLPPKSSAIRNLMAATTKHSPC